MGKAKSAVESQRRALEVALEFVAEARDALARRGFRLRTAHLVGSRARGDYTNESDVDVVLVVDGVDQLNTLERLNLVKHILKPKLEVMIYSTSEWYAEKSTWIKELKKEAKPLHETTHQEHTHQT